MRGRVGLAKEAGGSRAQKPRAEQRSGARGATCHLVQPEVQQQPPARAPPRLAAATCCLSPHPPPADGWVLPVSDSPKPPAERITLTMPVLNAAKQVAVVALGQVRAAGVCVLACCRHPAPQPESLMN